MKRYHFLQGLAVYWRGQEIMAATKTKKIKKKFTPFAYKRTIVDALARTFDQFADAGTIVMSYSSNAVPDAETIVSLLKRVKPAVAVYPIDHTYTFGTHSAATRRSVSEYLFVARGAPRRSRASSNTSTPSAGCRRTSTQARAHRR